MLSEGKAPTTMTFQSKDPTAPLQFAPLKTPPPFEAGTLVLKQIDAQHLDEIGRHSAALFSSFHEAWEENKARDIDDAETMLASLSPEGSDYEVRPDLSANRRFCGDGFLSRTRYYSLCQSGNGRDGGTMKRELMAYHDPLTQGVVDVYDLTDQPAEGAELPGAHAPDVTSEQQSAFLISIPPFTAISTNGFRVRRSAGRRPTSCCP